MEITFTTCHHEVHSGTADHQFPSLPIAPAIASTAAVWEMGGGSPVIG